MRFTNAVILAMAAAANAQEGSAPFPSPRGLRGKNTAETEGGRELPESAEGVEKLLSQLGKEEQRRLFILDQRSKQAVADVVCDDDFNTIYGTAMNVASVGAAVGGPVSAPASAGLYVIGAGVSLAQTTCSTTESDPFEDLKNFVTEHVQRKIEENNNKFEKAEINDDMSYLLNTLDTYLAQAEGVWSEKKLTMDIIHIQAARLKSDLFTPKQSMAATIDAMGITEDDWKAFTFDVATLFSMQFISIGMQKLANYNHLYGSLLSDSSGYLEGEDLYNEYKELLDNIDSYLDYFTSASTRANLDAWRREQYLVSMSHSVENDNCPQKKSNGNCRLRVGCRCIVDYTVEDTMSDFLYSTPVSTQLCFAEAYKNFWGTWINDFDSASCAFPSKPADDIKRVKASQWLEEIWNPQIWTDFAKNTEVQLDSVFGYQLRVGETCITSNGRRNDATASACDDHDPDQQWQLYGFRTFRLVDPMTSADDLTLGDGFILTTEETSEEFDVGDWYFETADDSSGSVYIRNHGNRGYTLAVDSNNNVIAESTYYVEDNINFEWIWESPHMKMAADETLCLARLTEAVTVSRVDWYDTGGLKVVSCENGEDGYENEWDLQMNDAYEFHIMQRGTELALSPDSGSISLEDFHGNWPSQRWTMTEDGYIQNVGSGLLISVGDDMNTNLGSVGDSFVKYPTMLDDQFADVLDSLA